MNNAAPPAPLSADAARIRRHIQSRVNPIRNLTPERLVRYLEDFDAGILRDAALVWQKMQERDDKILSDNAIRALEVEQLDYEILAVSGHEDDPEAELHKQALEWAYNNLTARDCLDQTFAGEASSLFGQMVDAQAKKWSVHELVWRQDREGNVTADFWHAPLWFFEARTGALRFLPQEGALDGVPLAPGKWLVARGRGIMQACSIAYLFKHAPLNDWLGYCEKFGIPGIHAETSAQKDTPEWEALSEAVANFASEWGLLTSLGGTKIQFVTPQAGSGALPQEKLVDRMDRAIARMWRGGDLSTMSAGNDSVGSMPQSKEGAKLLAGDAAMITSALNRQFDRQVIRYRFGAGVKPKAYFKLNPPSEADDTRELQIDQGLSSMGVELGKSDLRQRYGRPEPAEGEETVGGRPAAPAPSFGFAASPFANAAQTRGEAAIAKATALEQLDDARRKSLQPLIARIEKLDAAPPELYRSELFALQNELPALYRQISQDETLVDAFSRVLGATMATAAVDAVSAKPKPTRPAK